MKILFAIKALHDVRGGAERVLTDISSYLLENGHKVVLLTSDSPQYGSPFYPLPQGINKIMLGIGDPQRKTTFLEFLNRVKNIRAEVRAQRPDVVVAFMHSMIVPTALALIGTGIPVVASEHIVMDHYRKRRVEFWLLCVSSLFVKKITVLSDSIRAEYPGFMQRKMVAIANPVKRAKVLARPWDARERNVILNVGRLDPQKGQDILIEAFAMLARDYPDWDVHIYGSGSLTAELEGLIADKGLQDRVFLKGTTPDISPVYAGAQVFAMPSHYESFGLASAEAMAHGLPVVGFADCPGTNELVRDGVDGILVRAGKADRAERFKESLESLMNAPVERERLGKAGHERIKVYDIENIAARWESMLRDVIGDR